MEGTLRRARRKGRPARVRTAPSWGVREGGPNSLLLLLFRKLSRREGPFIVDLAAASCRGVADPRVGVRGPAEGDVCTVGSTYLPVRSYHRGQHISPGPVVPRCYSGESVSENGHHGII